LRDLARYSSEYLALPFERTLEGIRRRRVLRIVQGIADQHDLGSALEIGIGLSSLAPELPVKHVTVVEPLEWAVEQLSQCDQSGPSLEVFCGTLEGFFALSQGTGKSFTLVVASSVLHEIPDVRAALSQVHHLLTEGGWLVLVVPNSNSLHRLVGVGLGLLSALSDQTDTERKMQQSAARTEAEWTGLLKDAGFEVVASESFPLKPLDSAQMDSLHAAGRLTSEDIESLDRLADVFEGFGAELLLVCKKPSRCA